MSEKLINRWQKIFLVVGAIALIPIAGIYGFVPEHTLLCFYGIHTSVTDIAVIHILRSVMVLYLGMALFWVVGASIQKLRIPALYSLMVFMGSVALGEIFSFCRDGIPKYVFVLFCVSEIALAVISAILIKCDKKN